MPGEYYSHQPEQLEAHSRLFIVTEQILSLQAELHIRLIGQDAYTSARHKLEIEDSIIAGLSNEEKIQLHKQQKELIIEDDNSLLSDPDIEALDWAVEFIDHVGRHAAGDVDGFRPASIEADSVDLLRIEQSEGVKFLQVITLSKYYPHRQIVTQNRPANFRFIANEDLGLPVVEPLDLMSIAYLVEQMAGFYADLSQLDDDGFERWLTAAKSQFDV